MTNDLASLVDEVSRLRTQLEEALDKRDAAIREELLTRSVKEVAEICGMTESQVYAINRGNRQKWQ